MEIIIIVIVVFIVALLISIDRSMHRQNLYSKEIIKKLELILKKDKNQ